MLRKRKGSEKDLPQMKPYAALRTWTVSDPEEYLPDQRPRPNGQANSLVGRIATRDRQCLRTENMPVLLPCLHAQLYAPWIKLYPQNVSATPTILDQLFSIGEWIQSLNSLPIHISLSKVIPIKAGISVS